MSPKGQHGGVESPAQADRVRLISRDYSSPRGPQSRPATAGEKGKRPREVQLRVRGLLPSGPRVGTPASDSRARKDGRARRGERDAYQVFLWQPWPRDESGGGQSDMSEADRARRGESAGRE